MAMTTDVSGSISDRVAHLRSTLGNRYTTYRTYRNTLHELRSLGSRELDDLGLSRADLRRVAWTASAK